jgi:hypothetical protein
MNQMRIMQVKVRRVGKKQFKQREIWSFDSFAASE